MEIETPVRDQVVTFLRNSTSLGLFPLVGYGIREDTLTLLTSNIRDLTYAISTLEEVTKKDYNLGYFIPEHLVRRLVEGNPHIYKKNETTIPGLQNMDKASLGRIISVFGAPFYRSKAFAIVDICGFSRLGYSEQLSYLYSMHNLYRQAAMRVRTFCEKIRTPHSFSQSSTGDGMYIWSNSLGGNADVAVFMLLVCLLEQAERVGVGSLCFKASYIINSAFLLYDQDQCNIEYPVASNAVGAATNGAARLVEAARPQQLLVADFKLKGQGNELFDPAALLRQANELFRHENAGAATLKITPDRLLKVVDKHGDAWDCWNVSGEVPSGTPTRSFVGIHPDPAQDIKDLGFRRISTR